MRRVREQEESKMIPKGFVQDIRRIKMSLTEMRKNAGGTSSEGGEGLESVV